MYIQAQGLPMRPVGLVAYVSLWDHRRWAQDRDRVPSLRMDFVCSTSSKYAIRIDLGSNSWVCGRDQDPLTKSLAAL